MQSCTSSGHIAGRSWPGAATRPGHAAPSRVRHGSAPRRRGGAVASVDELGSSSRDSAISHVDIALNAGRIIHLGGQHPLPAGRRVEQRGAFTANAFFTAGQVGFEIPTGVIADTRGRRRSYLLGVATLLASTLLYVWMWQAGAALLGMGAGVDPRRPWLHILLRRRRSVAGRRPRSERLRRGSRVDVRSGTGRRGWCDARRLGDRGRRRIARTLACRTCCGRRCWPRCS